MLDHIVKSISVIREIRKINLSVLSVTKFFFKLDCITYTRNPLRVNKFLFKNSTNFFDHRQKDICYQVIKKIYQQSFLKLILVFIFNTGTIKNFIAVIIKEFFLIKHLYFLLYSIIIPY